jgi:predicted GNAT family N-acyltransferase
VVVRPARGEHEVAAALRLRELVFCGEQGVPPGADRDGRDHEALHLVALDAGRVIGTCRLVFDGDVARLGRMAVARRVRRSGVGAAMLAAAERSARDAGARRITLHAQTAVKELYSRHGFASRGKRFVEDGIEHVPMEKVLA